ncbi:MAG: hypothetical protein ABFD18_06875 [Syntrophomonas sp.]
METAICGLLFIAALLYLVYRVYRFFVKNEIYSCWGEPYRWKDERRNERCQPEEDRSKSHRMIL